MTVEVLNSKVSGSQLAKMCELNKTSQAKHALGEACPASVPASHLLVRSNCMEQHICARLQSCHKALVSQSLFLCSPLLPPAQVVYENDCFCLSMHREPVPSCRETGLKVYLRFGVHADESPEFLSAPTSAPVHMHLNGLLGKELILHSF